MSNKDMKQNKLNEVEMEKVTGGSAMGLGLPGCTEDEINEKKRLEDETRMNTVNLMISSEDDGTFGSWYTFNTGGYETYYDNVE